MTFVGANTTFRESYQLFLDEFSHFLNFCNIRIQMQSKWTTVNNNYCEYMNILSKIHILEKTIF